MAVDVVVARARADVAGTDGRSAAGIVSGLAVATGTALTARMSARERGTAARSAVTPTG